MCKKIKYLKRKKTIFNCNKMLQSWLHFFFPFTLLPQYLFFFILVSSHSKVSFALFYGLFFFSFFLVKMISKLFLEFFFQWEHSTGIGGCGDFDSKSKEEENVHAHAHIIPQCIPFVSTKNSSFMSLHK